MGAVSWKPSAPWRWTPDGWCWHLPLGGTVTVYTVQTAPRTRVTVAVPEYDRGPVACWGATPAEAWGTFCRWVDTIAREDPIAGLALGLVRAYVDGFEES